MTKVAVLDDWQSVAKTSADWSRLQARAEVVFFANAFDDENDAAAKLADFDIVLSMRERTPLPGSLINRLPKLRMLGMTGARNASLDTPACTARGVVVCNTVGGGNSEANRPPTSPRMPPDISPSKSAKARSAFLPLALESRVSRKPWAGIPMWSSGLP